MSSDTLRTALDVESLLAKVHMESHELRLPFATTPIGKALADVLEALEDIEDRYISDNNVYPAGFAVWAGERAHKAMIRLREATDE